MIEFLKWVFNDKLVEDLRPVVATFQIPGLDGVFAVYPPHPSFWIQVISFILLQIMLQKMFAALVYKLIIQKRNTVSAYLVGYAAIIPAAFTIPYMLLEFLDIQNKCLKLSVFILPTIVGFRAVEAMHGTSPKIVETSLGTYMTYYKSMTHSEWDPKTKSRRRITSSELLTNFVRVFAHFHLLSLILSFDVHFGFKPFPSKVELDEFSFNLNLFSPGHFGNTHILTVISFLQVALHLELQAFFFDNIMGIYTKPIFRNPVFASRSVADYCGRRWNLTIQRVLKHGVFLPARQSLPLALAISLTFLASGLWHEYLLTLIFYQNDSMLDENGQCPSCFQPGYFKVTLFALWYAIMVVLQHMTPLGRMLGAVTKSWPTIIVSTLQLMLALPISHWYTGDWAVGGFYADSLMGLWTIRKL